MKSTKTRFSFRAQKDMEGRMGVRFVDFSQAGPIGLNISMRIEKFLLTPRLDPEPNDIESSHRDISHGDGRNSCCAGD